MLPGALDPALPGTPDPALPGLQGRPNPRPCAPLRYGAVESVRLRSVPVKLDVKMPRRAAILTGNVAADRGTAHAYVVFADAAAAAAALALNMTEVRCARGRPAAAPCSPLVLCGPPHVAVRRTASPAGVRQ